MQFVRGTNFLRVVHRARFSPRADKFGFASALPRSSAKFTGDRSTSNGKWARVPSDEVNSASRRRRNRRKTSSGPRGRQRSSNGARRSPRRQLQPGENAKTLINVFCAVFTVLEYRAGGSLKSYKHLPACSLTCKTPLRLRRVLRRHNLLQRDYPRERNAENVFRRIQSDKVIFRKLFDLHEISCSRI